MYPRRPKAEAFSNAVDVVELLHDPTDPSTERTTPPCSAHVQLDDVPRALDLVEAEGISSHSLYHANGFPFKDKGKTFFLVSSPGKPASLNNPQISSTYIKCIPAPDSWCMLPRSTAYSARHLAPP